MLPSGPAVRAEPTEVLISVKAPAVVIRPIAATGVAFVNQRLPSGPRVIPLGLPPVTGVLNSVIAPAVVISPILLPPASVNQRLPSKNLPLSPAAMSFTSLWKVGTGYRWKVTDKRQRDSRPSTWSLRMGRRNRPEAVL